MTRPSASAYDSACSAPGDKPDRAAIDLLVPPPRRRRRAVATAVGAVAALFAIGTGAYGGAFTAKIADDAPTSPVAVDVAAGTDTPIVVRLRLRNDGFVPLQVGGVELAWPGYELIASSVIVDGADRPFPVRLAGHARLEIEMRVRVRDCSRVLADRPSTDDDSIWLTVDPLLAPATRQRVQVGRQALGLVLASGRCPG